MGAAQQSETTFCERHCSVSEIAQLWNLSHDTVRRLFVDEPGVLIIHARRRGTRVYRTLRIPETVAKRVHQRLSHGGRNGTH